LRRRRFSGALRFACFRYGFLLRHETSSRSMCGAVSLARLAANTCFTPLETHRPGF
jgi:hypothetical protein